MPAPTLTHTAIPRPRWSLKPDGPWRCHRCGELIEQQEEETTPGHFRITWTHKQTRKGPR